MVKQQRQSRVTNMADCRPNSGNLAFFKSQLPTKIALAVWPIFGRFAFREKKYYFFTKFLIFCRNFSIFSCFFYFNKLQQNIEYPFYIINSPVFITGQKYTPNPTHGQCSVRHQYTFYYTFNVWSIDFLSLADFHNQFGRETSVGVGHPACTQVF